MTTKIQAVASEIDKIATKLRSLESALGRPTLNAYQEGILLADTETSLQALPLTIEAAHARVAELTAKAASPDSLYNATTKEKIAALSTGSILTFQAHLDRIIALRAVRIASAEARKLVNSEESARRALVEAEVEDFGALCAAREASQQAVEEAAEGLAIARADAAAAEKKREANRKKKAAKKTRAAIVAEQSRETAAFAGLVEALIAQEDVARAAIVAAHHAEIAYVCAACPVESAMIKRFAKRAASHANHPVLPAPAVDVAAVEVTEPLEIRAVHHGAKLYGRGAAAVPLWSFLDPTAPPSRVSGHGATRAQKSAAVYNGSGGWLSGGAIAPVEMDRSEAAPAFLFDVLRLEKDQRVVLRVRDPAGSSVGASGVSAGPHLVVEFALVGGVLQWMLRIAAAIKGDSYVAGSPTFELRSAANAVPSHVQLPFSAIARSAKPPSTPPRSRPRTPPRSPVMVSAVHASTGEDAISGIIPAGASLDEGSDQEDEAEVISGDEECENPDDGSAGLQAQVAALHVADPDVSRHKTASADCSAVVSEESAFLVEQWQLSQRLDETSPEAVKGIPAQVCLPLSLWSSVRASIWVVILCMGGHFTAAVWNANGVCIAHRTFQSYIVRKKQGGRQSVADHATGTKSSAGANLRRACEVKFREKIAETFLALDAVPTSSLHLPPGSKAPKFDSKSIAGAVIATGRLSQDTSSIWEQAGVVAVYAPGTANSTDVFGSKRPPFLHHSCGDNFVSRADPRILPVPLNVKRATFESATSIYHALSAAYIPAKEM